MALVDIAPGNDVVHLNLPLRQEATEAHTVPGIKHNLLINNKLANEKYISIFDGDKLSLTSRPTGCFSMRKRLAS